MALQIAIRNVRAKLLMLLCLTLALQAGETGKISGVVSDQKTGEPLVGVNISVEGTFLGATTDDDGVFIILLIRPGRYTLQFSYLGYADVRLEEVRVLVDHTARVNVEMVEEAVQGQEVVVTAARQIIQKDLTSSTQFVGVEELNQLPITDTKEGIFLQTGVLFDALPLQGGIGAGGKGEPRYSIRGGSQDQVKWYIDGVRTAASIEARADRGGSFTSINLNAIQEVQVITGGYSAEYGEAQSGIVNVVTREGGDEFSGSAEFVYSPSGQRHFGNYIYDRSTQKEFLDHTLPDGSLDPEWWTPYRQRQIYDYRDLDDRLVYLTLGGPLFRSGDTRGTFFISSQIKQEAYMYPRPRDTRNLENVMVNGAFRLGNNIKVRISGLYNHEAHSTLQENADFTHQAKYYRGWGSLLDTDTYNFSLQWTHTLSSRLFYEVKLSRYFFDFEERPSDFTALGESENPSIFGFDRYNGFPDEPFDQFAFLYRNHFQNGDLSAVASLSWQFDRNNLLKTGFEFRYNTYNEIEAWRFPSFSDHPDDWLNRGLHESFHPLQMAAYVQDKMEFEGMILNLGLRYDYFNPNRDWFVNSGLFNLSADPEFDPARDPDGDQIDENGRVKYAFANVLDKPREPVRDYHMFSPRLGVSFPVTEKTLLHFNYGHFRQMPPLDRMFEFSYFRPEYIAKGIRNARQQGVERHIASNDGDPERVVFLTLEPLQPEKTIQFEVGVKHNFSDLAVLDVTAFYKDVFDQNEPRADLFDRRIYGYDPFRGSTTPNVFYVSNFPGDFGDSRGFEVTFRTLFSEVFTFDVNYSFSRATEGRASPGRINLDEDGNPTFVYDEEVSKRVITEKSFSRPHVLRANLFLRYPDRGKSFLSRLLRGGTASILYKLISGQTFTFLQLEDPPDEVDNHRYPSIQTVDLRLEKDLRLLGGEFGIYTRITNLLNTKNIRSFGDIFFDADAARKFVEEGEVSTTDAFGYDISYQTYYEKRRFYFGVKYNF